MGIPTQISHVSEKLVLSGKRSKASSKRKGFTEVAVLSVMREWRKVINS
ncbi:MAG: hypothetical protein OXD47_07640 [Gammaproteobacteria bacterium]|nr:hypothetical protein [Gammaproteobacteria bacterium]